ncbi:MAG: ABC transporter substrate-binding protein [Candidatus Omnitrophica bacterium]|nr:ABC transporter substrate-binding protein [Candidatus Omnitrophota bacterium]
MRRIIYIILIMFTLTIPLTEGISAEEKRYGGTLVWGTCNKPTIINPILTTTSVSMSLQGLLFNSLVRLNARGKIEPDLAESWDVSADGLTYVFHLKKGVYFHDGVECTAEDVKFTYDKILEPGVNSPFRQFFEPVSQFKVLDKHTFQITLKKPFFNFAYRLIREIVPRHILEKADLGECVFNSHPVGTGPFQFKEWGKDDQLTLEYNPRYFEGRPYLDKIIVKIYSDSHSLWVALMRGDIDYSTFIEREDYEIIKDDLTFKAFAIPWDSYYAVFYNLADSLLAGIKIRQAIAYGVDMKELIKKVAYGYGKECIGPFYPGSSVFNSSIKPYGYDPNRSLEILKEAGWRDEDNDGILEKNGEKLELRVLVDTRNHVYQRIIMVIRQQLQQIGIKVKAVLYDNEEMLTPEFLAQNKPQAQLSFPMAIGDSAESLGLEDWYSLESKRLIKLWVYQNKEVERLFRLAEATTDSEKIEIIYQKIHQLIYVDQPACFLYVPFVFHAISGKFGNVDDFFTLYMPYYTMKDWYIKQKGGD